MINIRLLIEEVDNLNLKQIKKILAKNNLPVWKLIRAMNISRNQFYSLSHQQFSGATDKLAKGLKKLNVIDDKTNK